MGVIRGSVEQDCRYAGSMRGVRRCVISSSGRLPLPADVQRRWNLHDGGPVDVIDLGFGVLTVPDGKGRRWLGGLLSGEEHAAFVRSLSDDSDLATT